MYFSSRAHRETRKKCRSNRIHVCRCIFQQNSSLVFSTCKSFFFFFFARLSAKKPRIDALFLRAYRIAAKHRPYLSALYRTAILAEGLFPNSLKSIYRVKNWRKKERITYRKKIFRQGAGKSDQTGKIGVLEGLELGVKGI